MLEVRSGSIAKLKATREKLDCKYRSIGGKDEINYQSKATRRDSAAYG